MTGKITGDGELQPDYRVVFVVPKMATNLQLHLKGITPIDFQPSAEVKPNIR